MCNDPRARAAVLAEMDEVGKEAQVKFSRMLSSILSLWFDTSNLSLSAYNCIAERF